MKTHTKEFFDNLSPQQAFTLLKEGNGRFMQNLKINRNLHQQLEETLHAQYPYLVALSCMDSRTSVELIFDQGIGEIFSIRIAGNIINDDIIGSMEYACGVVGSKLIVVVGHTRCGAIMAATENVELGHITSLLSKIQPAIAKTDDYGINEHKHIFAEKVAYNNVLHSIDELLKRSPIINDLYETGKIGIVGGMFSIENGRVHFITEMFRDTGIEKETVAQKETITM